MISGQWGPAAATGSTVTAISDDVTQICAEVQASRCAHDKGSIHLQQSPQSPDNAADTYSPLISPSPNDDSVLLVSHSMSGQEKMPQQGSQNQILHIWNQCLIRPSSHLLRSKPDQGATSVSSAPSRHPPHIGIESNKLVPSLPEHASFSFAPRKWKRSSSTSPAFSGIHRERSLSVSPSALEMIVLDRRPRQTQWSTDPSFITSTTSKESYFAVTPAASTIVVSN
jgi:hypothetical protein